MAPNVSLTYYYYLCFSLVPCHTTPTTYPFLPPLFYSIFLYIRSSKTHHRNYRLSFRHLYIFADLIQPQILAHATRTHVVNTIQTRTYKIIMKFLKTCLSLLGGIWRHRLTLSRPRPRPIALEFSILAKLPVELIICVIEFLPPIAAASFALSCTPIYTMIDAQHMKAIRNHQDFDSFQFVTLLERDLPNHLSCRCYKKLHSIERVERYIRFERTFRIPLPYLRLFKCKGAVEKFPMSCNIS